MPVDPRKKKGPDERKECLDLVGKAITHLQLTLGDAFPHTIDIRQTDLTAQKLRDTLDQYSRLLGENPDPQTIDELAKDVDRTLRCGPPCFYRLNVGGSNPSNWIFDGDRLGRYDLEDLKILELGFKKHLALIEYFRTLNATELITYLNDTWTAHQLRRCPIHAEDLPSGEPHRIGKQLLNHLHRHHGGFARQDLEHLVRTQSLERHIRISFRYALSAVDLAQRQHHMREAYPSVKQYTTSTHSRDTKRRSRLDQALINQYKLLEQERRKADHMASRRMALAVTRMLETKRDRHVHILRTLSRRLDAKIPKS
jgi:hypothetical protein